MAYVHVLFVTAALCNWTQLYDPRPSNASLAEITTPHQYCQDHGWGTAIAIYSSNAACQKSADAMSDIQGGKDVLWPDYRAFAWCEEQKAPASFNH